MAQAAAVIWHVYTDDWSGARQGRFERLTGYRGERSAHETAANCRENGHQLTYVLPYPEGQWSPRRFESEDDLLSFFQIRPALTGR